MTTPTPYHIELEGRISDRMLAPYLHDFAITRTESTTTMAGLVRDAAHLHGIVAHLTSLGLELVGITRDSAGTPS